MLFASAPTLCIDNQVLQGVSFFSPRSQSIDAARNIIGWHPYIHRYDTESWYGVLTATPEYTKSFHADRIAQALFGTDRLFISGSQVLDRGCNDILADYFGLSPLFQSCVELSPTIQNFIFTFAAYIGLDGWVPGLYLEIYAPAVWTRWNFQMCESVITGTVGEFPLLYMANDAVTPPISQFSDAFTGNVTFGQMTQPYMFGKICDAQTKGGLSDLQVILGYDIVSKERGHAGLNLRMAAPTGSRPNSEFFFEPIVGNGKHWEFGVGFDGKIMVWESDGIQQLSVFSTLNFVHIFGAQQCRSFDLCCNGFGSRFILAKEFDETGNYTGVLTPAINVTTLCCDVSVDLQFEFLFMFGYTHGGIEFDVGYNGWIRSKEKISLKDCIPTNKFGLKGIQDAVDIFGMLNAFTQSTATLHGDNLDEQPFVADPNPPVFFNTCDLDLSSAASPMVMTHKIFTYVGYGWRDEKYEITGTIPFIGVGLSVEFEGINSSNTEKPNENTLSQWAFWLKGGVSF